MLNALLDIYEDWKRQLDKLGQPYYLKLWLFEPRFSQSQVVCAIGNSLEYYETTFFKPELDKTLRLENYGSLRTRLEKLNWEYRLDEDHYDNCVVGKPSEYASFQDFNDRKKWFNRLLKKPHRTYQLKEPIGETTELYSFQRGDIWVGGY